jgi:cell division protein FtsQ
MTYQEPGRRWWPALIVASVAVLGGLLLHSPWLSLSRIDVAGAVRSDPAGRIADLGVGDGAILIWIDTGAVERAVESDPWVADAVVEREWPDRLRVDVLERDPVALIQGSGQWMLVATDGTVLEVGLEPTGGYLRAELGFDLRDPGERPSDQAWREVVELSRLLRDDIGGMMILEMRSDEVWSSLLGYQVRFGSLIDLADKGRTLRAMLGTDATPGSLIDVSAPSRPVVIPPGFRDVEP